MRRPTLELLPPDLRARAREVAQTLAAAGHRGWIVGGTVRDLALGLPPKDLDMASGAHPEAIEGLFPAAVGVGRAFGTLILPGTPDVELTTFRGDGAYADGRRPDEVRYGVSLEEDAARRDFTVNALYLDPLDGTLADPTGGLTDLEAHRLRTVGDPRERFEEDALRLLRLGRFAGRYDLTVPEDVLSAAAGCVEGLARVSGERIRSELERIGARPGTGTAIELLHGIGALGACFESWRVGSSVDLRRAVIEALGEGPGAELMLSALLFDDGERSDAELESLRPSRAERRTVRGLWRLARILEDSGRTRAALLRGLRELDEGAAMAWAGALESARAERFAAGAVDLRAAAVAVPGDLRRPEALLSGADLQAAGVPRGPLWGQLLAELEDLQLEGALAERDSALAWLGERAAQLGGNTRRS